MGRRATTGGISESRGKIRLRIYAGGKELQPVLNLRWTPANCKAALRMVAEIKEKIRHGIFDPGAYFPEYMGMGLGGAKAVVRSATFGEYAATFEKSLGKKAEATREDYRKQLAGVWLPHLADRPIADIRYSELVAIINELTVSGKTLNNYLVPLRGVFRFAKRDGAIAGNPAAELENAQVQRQPPDPFEIEEVETILADLKEREGVQIANYFAAAFFGGFRPSEQVALRWDDVDFKQRNVRVARAVVRGKAKASTKTYLVRDVELSERAWSAFEAQRAITQLAGRQVFWNPATKAPWADIQSQWKIWARCLKRLGFRYREQYQTRHTFATLALMEGANPTWVARQLGHANAQMLFKVYGKWIDGADKSRERDKLSKAFATSTTESAETVTKPSRDIDQNAKN